MESIIIGKTYPKILVISNNCFSLSNSNGRTLGNLFEGWPKEKLAQFCVIAQDPNWNTCDNYYCLEDREVLKAFSHFSKAEGRLLVQHQVAQPVDSKRANIGRKTVSKVALRELVWSDKRWNSKSFQQWVNKLDPDIVVLQFGDSFFMMDIAYYIASTRNIPLVIYNTEGYYFFPRNWHHISKWDNWMFPIYNRIYRKKVKRVMGIAKHCVYLNDKLKDDYDNVFAGDSTVIYNSSSVERSEMPLFTTAVPRISYLGNLGLDRDSALIEVGEVLQSISKEYEIDVYGKASNTMKQRFAQAPGVDYKGLVSYDEVKCIISESDILFHVETEKGYKERQLQYAFSTKIADSIASGKCFVLYAPKELACSKYMRDSRAGWIASQKQQLRAAINDIINRPEQRVDILASAKTTAEANHNFHKNAQKFQSILMSLEK